MSSLPNNLRINHEERRFLGVCAGIADYLDMPVVLVRIIFVISIISWFPLIFAYFGLYFWLDKDMNSEKMSDWLSGNAPAQHLKNLNYRRPLYRNMRNSRVAGVCSGIADYLEVKPFTVRAIAVLSTFILGPYVLLAYGVCWYVMEPNPAPRYNRYTGEVNRKKRRRRHRKRRGFSSSRINSENDDDVIYSGYDDGSDDPLYDTEPEFEPEPSTVTVKLDVKRKSKKQESRMSTDDKSMEECADTYTTLENRLRELEAFVTSKKFRLHCEINRI